MHAKASPKGRYAGAAHIRSRPGGDSVQSDGVLAAVLHGLDYLAADVRVAGLPHARMPRGAQGVIEVVVRLDARGDDDHVRVERLLCAWNDFRCDYYMKEYNFMRHTLSYTGDNNLADAILAVEREKYKCLRSSITKVGAYYQLAWDMMQSWMPQIVRNSMEHEPVRAIDTAALPFAGR